MPLAATQHIEITTSGNVLCGGAFNPGNANFATALSGLDCNTNTPRVFTGDYAFTTRDIGYHLFVATTGFGNKWYPGWYPIVDVTGTHAILSTPSNSCVLYQPTSIPYSNYNKVDGISSISSPTGGKWGIDYSQGTGIRYAFTDMRINGTGGSVLNFTSAEYPVGKNAIGNIINVYGSITGAWIRQRIEVSSTNASNLATCVASGAGLGIASQVSGTGGSGNLGGSLSNLGTAGSFALAGNKIFIKSSPTVLYTQTTGINNITGGGINLLAISSNSNASKLIGYESLRYDSPVVRPRIVLGSGVTNAVMISGAAGAIIKNLDLYCSGIGGSRGIAPITSQVSNCRVVNSTVYGISGANAKVMGCHISGYNSIGIVDAGYVEDCVVVHGRGNSTGIRNCVTVMSSISAFNSGVGIATNINQIAHVYGNLSVGNTSHGFMRSAVATATAGDSWANNISYGNGGSGFGIAGVYDQMTFRNNAAGANANNTIGENSAVTANIYNFITLTQNPFTNTGIMDFSLNTASGGGALLRDAAYAPQFIGIPSINYQDIGPIQSADSGVASSTTTGTILIQRRRRII